MIPDVESDRRSRVLAALAVVGVLAVGAITGTVTAAPGESDDPAGNPNLVASCGIDILVTLDRSGSIEQAGAEDDVQRAFRAFTSALKNTGSRLAVSEFSTVARLPLLPPSLSSTYTTVTNQTIASTFEPYITAFEADGSTNWEDGFRVDRYFLERPSQATPHLVVFITDGDPNQIVREDRVTYAPDPPNNTNPALNEYELKVPLKDTNPTTADPGLKEVEGSDATLGKDRAVPNANGLKADGSHILVVGVGNGLTSPSSLNRMIAVSGPDLFTGGTDTFDITTDDVYKEPDFTKLEQALRAAAFQLCAPSVNILKQVDEDPSLGENLQPGVGWSMNATVSPTPSSWVLPPAGAVPSTTTTTGPDGFANFQWRKTGLGSSTITVTEALKAGYVNDPSGTQCTYQTPDTPTDTPLPGFGRITNGFSGTVPQDAIVTCKMLNRRAPIPAIDIEKFTNGIDADAPTGPNVPVGTPVTWTYVVTNTGNIPVSSIQVTDSVLGAVATSACTPAVTSLAPGASMTCTVSDPTADPGQYANTGTVNATAENGAPVTDSDLSHYFGLAPAINIEKATNGFDADLPPGPFISPGTLVTWTYVVTNTGNTPLAGVVVTDNHAGVTPVFVSGDTNGDGLLDLAETWTYTATDASADVGQYENVGTVAAQGGAVGDTDASHYFGAQPAIDIEKATNGEDADAPTGPSVPVGTPVTWTYVVTNTGNIPVSSIQVTDSDLGVVCTPATSLAPGASLTCTSSDPTADPGQYANTGTVNATAENGAPVTDADLSHYFGAAPGINIEKATNGFDADLPPGPFITPGALVTWTYVVTNTGNTPLAGVVVTDNQPGVTPVFQGGDTDGDNQLDLTETWTYTATDTSANVGQYANVGTAAAQGGVSDSDASHYFGAQPAIDIEKFTNGIDADAPTGPNVPVGTPVTWTYVVTNTGNIPVSSIQVTDSVLGAVATSACTPAVTSLAPGASMTCTVSDPTADPGQYANTGTVNATAENGAPVTDSDLSHYFGLAPAINIEKATNGFDADLPPGPFISPGTLVTWTYVVTNTGNTPLAGVVVTDNHAGVTPVFVSGDTNGDGLLDLAETWTYTATDASADVGQYENVGTVAAQGGAVGDTDASHYFGAQPGVTIEKFTNLDPADVAPGPILEVGSTVNWFYEVTNTGNVDLLNWQVTDSQGVGVGCPRIALIAVGRTVICHASGTVIAGQYTNTGTVNANFPPTGQPVTANDPANYFGEQGAIHLEKLTNNEDADKAPGPFIPVGGPVTWTYVVTNTGNTPLVGVTIDDDKLAGTPAGPVGDTDGDGQLDLTETWTYTAAGIAEPDQYSNLAFAEGDTPLGDTVHDIDPSHYFGAAPGVDLQKYTNGVDADEPPGPLIAIGAAVDWTYIVTNSGNQALSGIVVTDNRGVAVTCPGTTLVPDAQMTCTGATGTAARGQYANIGTVTATAVERGVVTDTDPSHYFGADGEIHIENFTNGEDADVPTGPRVPVGSPVTWTYEVTNPGNLPIRGVEVVDDVPPPAGRPVRARIAQTGIVVPVYVSGDTDADGDLDVDELWLYRATGTAPGGQYENVATATGLDILEEPVADTDPSHHIAARMSNVRVLKRWVGPPASTRIFVDRNGRAPYDASVVANSQGDSTRRAFPLSTLARVGEVQVPQSYTATINCGGGRQPYKGGPFRVRAPAVPGRTRLCVIVNTAPPPLVIVDKRAKKATVEGGEVVEFVITVRNSGRAPATDLTVCDRLPDGLQFLRAKGVRFQEGDACWTIRRLGPGQVRVIVVRTEAVSVPRRVEVVNVVVVTDPDGSVACAARGALRRARAAIGQRPARSATCPARVAVLPAAVLGGGVTG